MSACFGDLDHEQCELIARCAERQTFEAGQFLFREGAAADAILLIEQGRVAIELCPPGRGPVIIQTLQESDMVGLDGVQPPHRRLFDAQALTFTQALAINIEQLQEACRAKPALGYEILSQLVGGIVDQLQALRLQTLEFYGLKG